ncbi:hypothetical protein JCM15519_00910 [Fundidesulfovibrio butyratiphilus]
MRADTIRTKGIFVTGTDTGVGKTVASALVCLALDGAYYKPFQSGALEDDDTAEVARLTGLPKDRFFPPAVRLKAPLSPLQAAELEGLSLDLKQAPLPKTDRPLVVEGAGGLLVPIAGRITMADLMARYALPVLVVARSGLGTVNHTLLTVEALRLRGLDVAGVALLGDKNPANRRDIEVLGRVPVVFEVEPLAELLPRALKNLAQGLDLSPLIDRPGQGDVLELSRRHVWRPFTQAATAPQPLAVERANGAILHTTDGRDIVDLVSSWWVTSHGHSHPRIGRAIAEQASRLEQVIFADFTHAPAARLAEKIVGVLPEGFSRVFYSDNGSTAVEVGVKMALQYFRNRGETGRTRLAALQGGYHGDTVGAMSVGFTCGYYKGFEKIVFPVDFLPYPATWMGDDEVQAKEDKALADVAAYFAAHPGEVAGVILEPLVQGAAGMRMVRPEFLRRLAELTTKAGALVIFDEVMTGFGRTGTLFACQRARVKPDIVCLAKGLSGGFLPLAATVAGEEIYQAFLGQGFDKAFAHGHSFTANPLGCAAGLASLKVFEEEDTLDKIARIEAAHRERLTALDGHPRLARARVLGSIGAVELTGTQKGYGAPIARQVQDFFLERDQYVRPLGEVFYIMAPFCLGLDDLHQAYDTLEEALKLPLVG